MLVNQECINIIKQFEEFRSKPYLDTAGVPTIGYGATYYEDDREVTLYDTPISESRAHSLLQYTVNKFAESIKLLVKIDLNMNQFNALVSFTFNVGLNALKKSTLLKKLNSGDVEGAADQFLVWNKVRVNGVLQISNGLARRRKIERALFLYID